MGYFHTPAMLVSLAQPLNFDELIRMFNDRVEQFTQRGSGYVLSNIIKIYSPSGKFAERAKSA